MPVPRANAKVEVKSVEAAVPAAIKMKRGGYALLHLNENNYAAIGNP